MLSVTLVHPAKAVGRNDMPFGRDTHMVPGTIVLDTGTGPPEPDGNGKFGVGICLSLFICKKQTSKNKNIKHKVMLPSARLLWPLFIPTACFFVLLLAFCVFLCIFSATHFPSRLM